MRIRRFISVGAVSALAAASLAVGALPATAEGQSGTTLTATKTMTSHLIKTYGWTIKKSVDQPTIAMFAGDSTTATYTVAVTKDAGTVSAYADGEICVTNGGEVATEGLTIVDNVTMPPSTTVISSVNVDTSAMPVLQPGQKYCYPYKVTIPNPVPGATYKDTADITITNHSGHLGTTFGPNPSATSAMPTDPTLVNDSVRATDTNGMSWTASDTATWTYPRTFTCSNEGINPNTATITETGQSASASVTVTCYRLSVAKTAETSWDRKWSWSITKSANPTSLTLAQGQTSPPITWTVTVDPAKTDSNALVTGTITVTNPAPKAATLTSVTDVFTGANATVSCSSMTVPAATAAGAGSLQCSYKIPLTSNTEGTNTATAMQQNYAYAADGPAKAGTTSYSGTAAVAFSSTPTNETDECVDVTDTLKTTLGKVCQGDATKTFTYTTTVGPYATAGTYTVPNTATFTSNDTGATGSSTATVTVTVPALGTGCTLTQGYWKTHSAVGPAPYDKLWASYQSTMFFLSGKTWYQVYWTAPAGNPYYILADQYMAATMNIANGASSTPEVTAALAGAKTFFDTYSPTSKLTAAQKAQLLTWATLLNSYNTGAVGPRHCSE